MMMYLLLANLYLGIFYLFYHVMLRQDTFFNRNRFYLLSALMLSFTLPFVELPGISRYTAMDQHSVFLLTGAGTNTVVTGTAEAGSSSEMTNPASGLATVSLQIIYIAGCLISLCIFLTRMLYTLYLIRRKNHSGAFSFFSFIRVDREITGSGLIQMHEQIHAREWHSLDIILMQVVKIFNWFNPVVYLMERSLKLQHEYRADSQVAHQNLTHYAELLLATALRVPAGTLTNQFINPTLLKSRIMMLLKNKTPKQKQAKFALAIPMVATMVLVSAACNQSESTNEQPVAAPVEVESPIVAEAAENEKQETDTVVLNMPPTVEPPPPRADQVRMPEMTVVPAGNQRQQDQIGARTISGDPVRHQGDSSKPIRIELAVDVMDFDKVEVQPIPPGGSLSAFRNWFTQTLEIPQEAHEGGFSGPATISFVIEPSGQLSSFVVALQGERGQNTNQPLSDAIKETLKKSAKWKPGIHNGKTVRVHYNLSVRL